MRWATRRSISVPLLVASGLIGGALVGWWGAGSGTPRVATGAPAGDEVWTTEGWVVSPERPWEGSVVRITTSQCGDTIRGSGVIVDGVVLTNDHVVAGATRVRVTTSDGTAHDALAILTSSSVDVAELTVDGLDPGLELASEDPPTTPGVTPGPLAVAGFPAGHDFTVKRAAVVGELRGRGFPDPRRAAHLDLTVVPGESGSAVVDADGRLAGLVYARATDDGKALVIPASQLRAELPDLDRQAFERC